jgi:carbamoyl-phosphate synthase large subunit
MVHKISSKKHPNVLDILEDKQVDLVINTPENFSHDEISDGYLIRRKAIDRNIPLLINIQKAKLLAKSLLKYQSEDDLPIFSYEAGE